MAAVGEPRRRPSYTPCAAADGLHEAFGGSVTARTDRRRLFLAALAAAAFLIGGVALTVADPSRAPAPTDAPASTRQPATRPPQEPPPPPGTTYRDFIFETAVVTAPTAAKAQSKLWFADGSWWAGLFQPATNHLTIFRLDWATQSWIDTGTLIDERPFADPDFLWTGEHLYVVSAGPRNSSRHAARILRFSYDESAGRYALDPNFPVTITDAGASAAVIARDTTGVLWVAFAGQGRVWVARSLGHDAHWGRPYPLPVAGTTVDVDDIASIVSFGPGHVGVMWSNQLADSVYFSVRRDGDPDDAWSEAEVVIEGLGSSDDHINLKTFPDGGRTSVVAALKTSLDGGPSVNPLSPLILLAVRQETGAWSTHLVGRVRDRHTRAIVMVDDVARMFYVAATGRGGSIVYKRSPIDSISFEVGRGEELVASASDPQISNASSSKQALRPETGLVVIASDNTTGRYLHGVIDLGGGLPLVDPATTVRPDRPDAPDPPSPVVLVWNDFEPWPIGPADDTPWVVRDTDPASSLTIVDDGAGGRALRVRPAPDGTAVRACRDFADVPGTTLSIEADVRLSAAGSSDTSLLSLRGSGGEVASVRVTTRGGLAWFAGSTKSRSEAAFRLGAWYRIVATADQASRTFTFRVEDQAGTVLVRQSKLAWRTTEVESIRSACLETASGAPRQALDLGDIRLLQEVR